MKLNFDELKRLGNFRICILAVIIGNDPPAAPVWHSGTKEVKERNLRASLTKDAELPQDWNRASP